MQTTRANLTGKTAVVTGASKAGILRALLAAEKPDERLPASWLANHRQVCLWADAEALHPS